MHKWKLLKAWYGFFNIQCLKTTILTLVIFIVFEFTAYIILYKSLDYATIASESATESNYSAQMTSQEILELDGNIGNRKLCPLTPPGLKGQQRIKNRAPSMRKMEHKFSMLQPGGRYKPTSCTSRHKVAIVVPYRDRRTHLRLFLYNLHPFLMKQQLDYGIYIIEENPDQLFNRAMLMNIGYTEALKQYNYDCFIFHDVDLIPENDRNLYTCTDVPKHMSVAVNTMRYRLPYGSIFGGVCALNKTQMEIVNGFSNEFWGWGGEDDDMYNRIRYHDMNIFRYPPKIARYTMLKHTPEDQPNPYRREMIQTGICRYNSDGLSNLEYERVNIVFKKLYTWIFVAIAPKDDYGEN